MDSTDLDHLRSLLPKSDIFEKDAPGYKEQSAPWSTWADQRPPLVLQPTSLQSMSTIVKALYNSGLDFAVRNTGTGSVSAQDVILSTHGFKSYSFDKDAEIVTIGSGLDWGEVDRLMEENAPGHQVVGARCSWVGVTGSALVGGLSWLSHEFGMISDPQNLLDMQVVLRDGRIVWASEEDPELMWALRGGGGNFGGKLLLSCASTYQESLPLIVALVVTALKLQARPYTDKIFMGFLMFPYSQLQEVSKGVSAMAARPADPKIAMHIVNRGRGMGEPAQGGKPGIAVMMYDAHGEEHGRSEEAFGWVFKIPEGQPFAVQETTLRKMNALAESFREWQGNNMFWLSAPLLAEIDDDTLVRAWKWWEDSIDRFEGFQEGSTVLLEYMQEVSR